MTTTGVHEQSEARVKARAFTGGQGFMCSRSRMSSLFEVIASEAEGYWVMFLFVKLIKQKSVILTRY